MRRLLPLLLTALFLAGTAAAAEPRAGQQYRLVEPPMATAGGEKIEVTEFFSYGCPHCFNFRPMLHDWVAQAGEGVQLVRVPVTFGHEAWELLARAYYVAEVLGVLDKTHAALFDAIHVQGRSFASAEEVADFYASLGVDREKALAAFDSFAVDSMMRRGQRLVRDYRVAGTPSMAVDGRYFVDVRGAGGQQGMLSVVDYLVERARN